MTKTNISATRSLRSNDEPKNVRVCCTVVGENLEEFLKNLEETQKICSFVELRVDYIKNLKLSDLDIIRKNTTVKSIFTCRSVEEGGKFKGSTEELLEIINKANDLKFEHIDIEISKLEYIKFNKKNAKIIGSYHNFKKTPKLEQLYKICENMSSYEVVDILKVATYVNCDDDMLTITRLILAFRKKNEIIAIGMGEKGRGTRITGPLLGTYLSFAYVGDNKTAPGQVTLDEFKDFYKSKKINKD